jgi:hypothetical protein
LSPTAQDNCRPPTILAPGAADQKYKKLILEEGRNRDEIDIVHGLMILVSLLLENSMLAKRSSKNQITLPKAIVQIVGEAD